MKNLFCALHILLLCATGDFSALTNLVPAIYPPMKSTSEKCQESSIISSPQLSNILQDVSLQVPSLPMENCGSVLDTFFHNNPQVEAAYYNQTYLVQTLNIDFGSQETTNELLSHLATMSCKTIYQMQPSSPSGHYMIRAGNGSLTQVYCDMEGDKCGGEGGWMRVAHLDMTQPESQCPQGFGQQNVSGTRYCGRFETNNCVTTTFPSHGVTYMHVCGRLRGYQYGTPTSFRGYWVKGQTINSYYVDGASITYGSPRKHIWTYACGVRDSYTGSSYSECPCNTNGNNENNIAPSFVGDDYYCESGAMATSTDSQLFSEDPLWDGEQCLGFEGPCCTNPNMPWFVKALDQPSSEDTELRMCAVIYAAVDDVLVDLIDIYIR